jgi:hypothetical protein
MSGLFYARLNVRELSASSQKRKANPAFARLFSEDLALVDRFAYYRVR